MDKVLTLTPPTKVPDYAYVMAVLGTMDVKPTKEPPEKDELIAYYTNTRVVTGISPTNLDTFKAALGEEVEIVKFDDPKKFTDAVAEAYFEYLETLPEEVGMRKRFQMLERSANILAALEGKRRLKRGEVPRPNNCGEGTIRIQGRYPAGGKFVQDICLACAKEAIAGDPNRIQMFNDPKSIQGLLMAVMGEASLQRIM